METIRFNFVSRINTFFTIIAIIFAICLSNGNYSYAQTTKTVGTAGDYATLGAAFDAINSGSITGAITLQIISNITETASAVLNSSGSGSASYTVVNIYPTVTGLSISGNLATPLIDLNGADNVTIDGRVNGTGGTKDLIISNTSTSTDLGTSTIRFINDASTNTVKYCNIKGSTRDALAGIIFFSTTTGSTGNDGNTIYNNNITNVADANRPINAIYSNGGSGTNSGDTISNNNIYDFFNAGANSQGIYIRSYSSEWSITGNNFYETTTFAPTGAFTYYTIRIDGGSGNNFTVSDNIIGGSASDHTGTFTLSSATSHTFYGLYLSVGTTIASSVQNNTIKSISSTSTSGSPFYGMNIVYGNVNIGTVTGNTIGSTTGNGSISLTNSTANSTSRGIYCSSSGTVNIQKNSIGSITTVGSATTYHSFNGICAAGGASGIYTINDNTIGSESTTNSIWASSSTTDRQDIYGIININTNSAIISGNTVSKLTNAAIGTNGRMDGIASNTGTNTITNNTIHDLTSALNTSDGAVRGIFLFSSTAAAQTITGNTIYNLSNTNTSFAGYVTGIYYWETTTDIASTVSKNFIYNLSVSASSTAATIYGINITNGAATYSNNMISLGGNTPTTIYGIYEKGAAGNNNNLYFNTVYISGVPTSGTNKSYALFSEANTNTRDFRNNIFFNARSTTSGNNLHYAAYFYYGSSSNLTLDYNDYYAPGTGGVLGYYNSANVTTLDAWKIAIGQDGNSTSKLVTFVSATDLHLSEGSIGDISLIGTPIDGITTDYFGNTRNATYPYMGGNDVTDSPLPVLLTSLNSVVDGRNVRLNWVTSSEINNAGFEVERAEFRSENLEFRKTGYVAGKGTTNTQTNYMFADKNLNTGKYKYRLKQIDNNGNFEYHNLNGEVEIGVPTKFELSQNYPNPFNPTTKIDFALPNDSKVSIKVYDITGREVMNIMNNEQKTAGYYTININPSMLSSGVYFYRMISDKFIETKKMTIIK
ncbi:MAG TPA: T9SS type A sorting domain-containing protein [Ignavibacteria bacterium]